MGRLSIAKWTAKEVAEVTGAENALGVDVSGNNFSLAELTKEKAQCFAQLEWKPFRDSGNPIKVLHDWMLQEGYAPGKDDYIICDCSLRFVIQEEMVMEGFLLVLVFDCGEMQLKLILFR